MSLANSISRAYSVTLAFRELARDVASGGELPSSMAETMCRTARDMAVELSQQMARAVHVLPSQNAKALRRVCTDLEALGDLAGLVLQFDLTPKHKTQLMLTLEYTAERTAGALMLLEDAS